MDGTRIESWEQFQRRFASSLSRIQDDRLLGLAAAANPLYALEELGFTIPRDVEASIAEHLRFKPQTLARIRQLRDEVHRHAGRAFDISSPDELERVLFDHLKIVRPSGGDGSAGTYHAKAGGRFASPLPQQVGAGESPADPLETLRGAHPIVPPLLEYRQLEARGRQLASRAVYDQLRQGQRELPVERVRLRMKKQPA